MKIGPLPLPVPLPAGPQPLASQTAQSIPGFPEGADSRAARFAAFGMFGRDGQMEMPAAGDPVRPPAAPIAAPRADFGPMPPPAPAEPRAGPVEVPPEPLLLPLPDTPAPEPAPRPAPAAAKPVETCSLPEPAPDKVVEIESCAGPEPQAVSVRPRRREAPQRPAVSLTLREENGAVAIIAGSTPMNPESRALLRRLVEVMLARSGLRLAQFQLNGAPLAPDSLGRTGGMNGSRTG